MRENYQGSWRIVAAVLFSSALIVSAYLLARSVESPSAAKASAETDLLAKIASRDTDGDGLPDWEEALYGSDPQVADTFHLGMTDGAAVAKGLIVPKAVATVATTTATTRDIPGVDPSLPVPAQGTLTRAVAESFTKTYVQAIQDSPDGTLSDADVQKIANDVITQLDQSIVPAPDYRSLQALKVTAGGADALRTFAASAEAVFLANTANATTSELEYLKSAIQNDDTTAFPHLVSLAKLYKNTAAGLAVLPVPKELAADDLALINSLARLGAITNDFTRANSDPLATMLALKQYPDALQKLSMALTRINGAYSTAGVTFAPGEAGASLVTLIDRVAASQKTAKKTKP